MGIQDKVDFLLFLLSSFRVSLHSIIQCHVEISKLGCSKLALVLEVVQP